MKKFRKLIPAFVLLLISTAIMSSATFAWFSMNTQVTATGMSVTAKSDSIFLQIDTDSTIDDSKVTATIEGSSAVLKPVTYLTAAPSSSAGFSSEGWYESKAAAPTASTTDGVYSSVGSGSLVDYVQTYTFYVNVSEGKGENLYLSGVTVTKVGDDTGDFTSAIKVRVYAADTPATYGIYGNGTVQSSGTPGRIVLASEVTTTAMEITVEVYIDGEDSSVYSNAFNTNDYQVTILFNVDGRKAD